jgi:hypothetical protein
MTTKKRDYSNFEQFPGKYNKGTNRHEFPILWQVDQSGKLRQWQIFVRLIKESKELSGIDWNLLDESYINIEKSYYTAPISILCVAQIWVEGGIHDGKITRYSPTYIKDLRNEGKTNERNVFQGALIDARSMWNKHIDKGFTEDRTFAEKKMADQLAINPNNGKKIDSLIDINVPYFPMLATKYEESYDCFKFPMFVQPKLDGVRCIVFIKKANGNLEDIVAYTRKKNDLPIPRIRKLLLPHLRAFYDNNAGSIYLDGEIYRHGEKLQTITSAARSESNSHKFDAFQQFHIFDCFYPTELGQRDGRGNKCIEKPKNNILSDFTTRHAQLKEIFKDIEKDPENKDKVIQMVPTVEAKSEIEATSWYTKWKELGYEGAMLRNACGLYLADTNSIGQGLRSKNLVKLKPTFTDEYKLIGYTEGTNGRDKKAILWICETKNGKQFNATPKNMDYAERYALFAECEKSFDKKYKGRTMTCEYQDLSIDKVPQRAKAVGFRDYE